MLHRVVFLLKIRYAFAVSIAELCFVDVGTFRQLTIVRGSAFVREGAGELNLSGIQR